MSKKIKITEEVVKKVIAAVDAGLIAGIGKPSPGEMCVEAAVCYALGLPHSDNPGCVDPCIRALEMGLNDAIWSSRKARAMGLRKLAVLQLGTAGCFDEVEFAARFVPLAQIVIATGASTIGTFDDAAVRYIDAAAIRRVKAVHAARYARYARANGYSRATEYATDVAAAVRGASAAAAYAARAAGCEGDAAADAVLRKFADDVAEILIDMKVPSVRWLPLLDAANS